MGQSLLLGRGWNRSRGDRSLGRGAGRLFCPRRRFRGTVMRYGSTLPLTESLLSAGIVASAERRPLVAHPREPNGLATARSTALALRAVDLPAVAAAADADLSPAGRTEIEPMSVGRARSGPRHLGPARRRGLDRPAATTDTPRWLSPSPGGSRFFRREGPEKLASIAGPLPFSFPVVSPGGALLPGGESAKGRIRRARRRRETDPPIEQRGRNHTHRTTATAVSRQQNAIAGITRISTAGDTSAPGSRLDDPAGQF
jgi:hypothetical protein